MQLRRYLVCLAVVVLAAAPLALADHDAVHTAECNLDPSGCPAAREEAPQVAKPDAPAVPQEVVKVAKPDLLDEIQKAVATATDAVGDMAGAIGTAVSDTAYAIADVLVAIVVGTGRIVVAIGAALVAFVQFLVYPFAETLLKQQPKGMPTPAYAAAASAGTAVVAGSLQAGLYALLRKYGLWLAFVPGFSRIAKDELLDNDRRAKIFEMIKQNPGTRLNELADGLELPWGSAMHHLRKLRADRLILFKTVGAHKCYFVNGSGLSEQEMAAASLLKGDTLQGIATFLRAHPGSNLKEVAQAVGISSPLAAFHVSKLERAGLLQKVRDGRAVRLQLLQPAPARLPGANAALGTPPTPSPTAA